MIAICRIRTCTIHLLDNTPELKELLAKVRQEFGKRLRKFPAHDKLDELLSKAEPVKDVVVPCEAVFLYQDEF